MPYDACRMMLFREAVPVRHQTFRQAAFTSSVHSPAACRASLRRQVSDSSFELLSRYLTRRPRCYSAWRVVQAFRCFYSPSLHTAQVSTGNVVLVVKVSARFSNRISVLHGRHCCAIAGVSGALSGESTRQYRLPVAKF